MKRLLSILAVVVVTVALSMTSGCVPVDIDEALPHYHQVKAMGPK